MKQYSIKIALIFLFSFSLCWSQVEEATIDDFKPSSVNQLGKQYPQVNSEGRVLVRIEAKEAKRIKR
tara:strand:- start:438 stop:638 length:201 start_codon:yes stop_codon:yes gene_type:complete